MIYWENTKELRSKSYVCGYCGEPLASEKGYHGQNEHGQHKFFIYICHSCNKPTFFDYEEGKQTPGSKYGYDITGIDDQLVSDLYLEARNCYAQNAFTATILCCRKLLMHIAVVKGAEPNKKFIEYIEFLSKNNFIPNGSKEWVDHIRDKGNEANHEIVLMKKEDAEDLLNFMGMMLKIIYEFPATVRNKKNQD